MTRIFPLLLLFALLLPASDSQPPHEEELEEAQIAIELSLAVENMQNAILRLREAQEKVELGVAAPWSVTKFSEELDRARRAVDAVELKRSRLEWMRAAAKAEEEAIEEAQRRAETASLNFTGRAEKFEGQTRFHLAELARIELDFMREFGKPLPVSARGQTSVHRSLGFNHNNRVDIALTPDSDEGRWLRQYLQDQGIPYFAFRTKVRGSSTAPHIHIGPPSVRLAP